jgi:copper chaperone CopZ
MAQNAHQLSPDGDQFVMIRIEGMHCHRCQQTIQKSLQLVPGVHEVEVDFPSGQASVLYDPRQVNVRELMETVAQAGYRATGFSQGQADRAAH